MKSSIRIASQVVGLWLGLAPGMVAGQEGAARDPGRLAPVQHLRFTDEDVEASRLDPDGDLIEVVSPAEHSSLIEIRQSFEAEIVKTMESF